MYISAIKSYSTIKNTVLGDGLFGGSLFCFINLYIAFMTVPYCFVTAL